MKKQEHTGRQTGLSFLRKWPFWAAALGVVAVVLLVRQFGIGSYRISTPAMETALHKGDYVLVDKLAPRGILRRNEVVLLKSPLQKDKARPPLFASRVIGLPGDTLEVSPGGYRVNGRFIPHSPPTLLPDALPLALDTPFVKILGRLGIPQRGRSDDGKTVSYRLSAFEAYQIRGEMTERMSRYLVPAGKETYRLVIPRKGQTCRLTREFLTAARDAIRQETDQEVTFRDGPTLYLDRQPVSAFRFSRDYYWVLSDNPGEAVDSRHLGFIPADHIVGAAWFCWYSSDKQRRLQKVR